MPEITPASGGAEEELDLTVLLPCFNEQEAIGPVVRELRDALTGWPGTWEILIVDDASTDESAARAEAADVRVVRRVQNAGAGAARKTGIREARGRLIAMIDAGRQRDLAAQIGRRNLEAELALMLGQRPVHRVDEQHRVHRI